MPPYPVLRTHCPAGGYTAQPPPLTIIGSSGGGGGSSGGVGGSGGSGGRYAASAPREASTHLRSSALGGMAQSVHSVALPKLNFPAGQKLQSSVLSPALYFPASHAVHWPALALAWQ